MHTRLDLFRQDVEPEVVELDPVIAESAPRSSPWSADQFGDEQIRTLVRKVFLPGWPKPARQIVVSAVDENAYIAEICVRIATALSAQISGTVAVVEASPSHPELEDVFGGSNSDRASGPKKSAWRSSKDQFRTLRDDSIRLSSRVWLVPWQLFRGEQTDGSATAILRDRFGELRLDFDYTILHGPTASSSEASLLGHLSDGVVLILEAGKTRRIAAQRVQESLHSANAKLLGTVLSERQFPIPASIYRKL